MISLEEKTKKLERENGILKRQVSELSNGKAIEHNFGGERILIGMISDTHKGSIYENQTFEESLIKYFNRKRVDAIYHCGDLLDGVDMYRGHEYELQFHGADAQVDHFVRNFPFVRSKLYFITGNHDQSFWTSSGADIGTAIAKARNDTEYLGRDQALIKLGKNAKIMLLHPSGGTAYAISYKSQKVIESFSGGQKPDAVFIGHYHKYDHIFFRNVQGFQVPTTQSQTPYMKRKPTPAILGGILIDIRLDKKGIAAIKSEYLPFYER